MVLRCAWVSRGFRPGGRVILSLRHGPMPAGRRMFAVSAEETVELAGRYGLEVVDRVHSGDTHGRPGVSWSTLVLQRPHGVLR